MAGLGVVLDWVGAGVVVVLDWVAVGCVVVLDCVAVGWVVPAGAGPVVGPEVGWFCSEATEVPAGPGTAIASSWL